MENNRFQVLICFFNELNAEIRARRVAEYTYTAASIGAFGAFAWGVAAIAAISKLNYEILAITAIAITMIFASVTYKIMDDNQKHFKLRREVVNLAELIARDAKFSPVPNGYQSQKDPGTGYIFSIMVLSVSASGAIAFCTSLTSVIECD